MKKKLLAIIATAAMVVTMIPSMVFADATYVAQIGSQGYPSLQAALDAASTAAGDYEIVLSSGTIDEDVTVDQKSGVNITIKGNNTMFTGQIFIDGNGRATGAETLTIDNVDFNTSENKHSFIETSKKNYPHNVTIKNSSFTSTASERYPAIYWRQGYKLEIIGCEADGLMSLLNAQSGMGPIIVDGCIVTNCGNAVVADTKEVTIKNSKISTSGASVSNTGNNNGTPRVLNIENCEIEGSVPILVRSTTAEKTVLNVSGNNKLKSSAESGNLIVITKVNGTGYTKPDVKPQINITDEGLKALDEDGFIYVSAKPDQTPADPEKPTTPEKPEKSPNTGDNSLPYTLAVAGLALAAMAAVVATRRRTN